MEKSISICYNKLFTPLPAGLAGKTVIYGKEFSPWEQIKG